VGKKILCVMFEYIVLVTLLNETDAHHRNVLQRKNLYVYRPTLLIIVDVSQKD
jgi:hypothetical protein